MQKSPRMRSLGVYGLFALSGGSALIYQILWSRWLSLSLGNTTISVSIVLASFMLGLALGSAAAGRFLSRIKNPLRVYAALELGIAFYAVAFPMLYECADSLLPLSADPGAFALRDLGVRAAFAALLLLTPTTMMGATLPLLAEFFRRNPQRTRSFKIGVLYAANTLGAALGILAASFALIELIGVYATTTLAAAMNLIVAGIGYHYSRSPVAIAARSAGGNAKKTDLTARLALTTLAAGGAAAMASEVLWTRALESVLGASTYSFATIVFLYLAGIALGSWLMSLAVPRRNRVLWLAALQLAMGAWMFVAIPLVGKNTEWLIAFNGKFAALSEHLFVYLKISIVLLPLSLASGACFPLAARMIDPDSEDPAGEAIARAYGWNTIGGVIGSLIAGFLIAPRFDIFEALFLLALIYGLIAAAVLAAAAREERVPRLALAALTALVAAASLAGLSRDSKVARRFTRRPEDHAQKFTVRFHRPGLQGVVTAGRMNSMNAKFSERADFLLVNGGGMTAKYTETKMMAHLPLLLHPEPKQMLVICFGMGTTYRSALTHGGKVTVVELSREVVDAFPAFYEDSARILANPNGRIVVNDGRNFLRRTTERYDVITLDPPPPIDMPGVVNLYTSDFLELAKSRLNEGGLVAHWYPFPGSASGVDDESDYYGLVLTFARSFPYVYGIRSWSKMGMHLIGTSQPLDTNWGEVKRRLGKPEIARDLREWDPIPDSYFAKTAPLPKVPRGRPLLTDDNPWLEFYLVRTLRAGGKKMYQYRWW